MAGLRLPIGRDRLDAVKARFPALAGLEQGIPAAAQTADASPVSLPYDPYEGLAKATSISAGPTILDSGMDALRGLLGVAPTMSGTAGQVGNAGSQLLSILPPAWIANPALRVAATRRALESIARIGADYVKPAEMLASRYPRHIALGDFKGTYLRGRGEASSQTIPESQTRYVVRLDPIKLADEPGSVENTISNTLAHEMTHGAQYLRGVTPTPPPSLKTAPPYFTFPEYPQATPYFFDPREKSARVSGISNEMRMVAQNPKLSSKLVKPYAQTIADNPYLYFENSVGDPIGSLKRIAAIQEALRDAGVLKP